LPLFRKKVEDAEKRFGPESAVVAASVEQLADLYADQGKGAEAEPLYRQAVAMWEKAEGPDYPYATACCFARLKFAAAKQDLLRPGPSISRSSQSMTNIA
jgi:Tetratricopeptide repeat